MVCLLQDQELREVNQRNAKLLSSLQADLQPKAPQPLKKSPNKPGTKVVGTRALELATNAAKRWAASTNVKLTRPRQPRGF